MEHPGDPGVAADHRKTILRALPLVDDHRQAHLLRDGQLGVKAGKLDLCRVAHPVVVHAGLADGPDLGMPGQAAQKGLGFGVPAAGKLRVPAHGGVDEVILLRQGYRGFAGLGVAADVGDKIHALPVQVRQKPATVFVKGGVVVMGVGVKNMHGVTSCESGVTSPAERSPGGG